MGYANLAIRISGGVRGHDGFLAGNASIN